MPFVKQWLRHCHVYLLMEDEELRNEYAKNAYAIREHLNKDKVGDMFLKFILEGKL